MFSTSLCNADPANAAGPLLCQHGPMDYDVLIIGGGIAGLSLAWRLAPQLSVVVVEAESTLAFHSSSRSARQMQPSYGPAPIQELTMRTLEFVERLSAGLPAPILVPRPLLTLGTQTDVAALVARNAHLVPLSHAETMERSPDLHPGAFEAAALDSTAMEVDVPTLIEFYRSQAVAAGALVLTDSRVIAVVPHGSAGFSVAAGERSLTASMVVNAAGAWADTVAQLGGVRSRRLVPHRRSAAIVSTEHAFNPGGPMVQPTDESYYFRPDGPHLLISPCESIPAEPGDAQVVDADISELISRIGAVTRVGITGVVRAWTGLRTHPVDGLPVVGFDADVPNFFWLAGQGGYGIQTSAALAGLAAALITGTLTDDDGALAAALSPQRAGLG